MLKLYRRHLNKCKFASTPNPRKHFSCVCPIWTQGTLHGKPIKKSLDVRSWEAGQKIVRDWEAGGPQTVTVAEACDKFIVNCTARNLGHTQLGKYKILTAELKAHFANRTIGGITVDDLRTLQAAWTVKPITAQKRIERLRRFFRFCVDSDWTNKNPAKLLDPPRVPKETVLPFTTEDWNAILKATADYSDTPPGRRAKVKAFVLVLRFCGLRIRDAVTLRRDAIKNGKLILKTAKAGTMVYLPLKPEVLDALAKVKNDNPTYFFWTGNSTPKTAVGRWQDSLRTLFKLAVVTGAHAHRFRHTFALDLLSSKVSLENVAKLMGNTPLVAQRHYAAWVPQRQAALEVEVSRAWKLTA